MTRKLTRKEIQEVADSMPRDFDTAFGNVRRAITAEFDIEWPSIADLTSDVDKVVEIFHLNLEQESYSDAMESCW